jgi:hypothetical protein
MFSYVKKNMDVLVASVAGFIIIFLFTRHSGIGVCPDGIVFSTAAENLKTTGRLSDFENLPLVNFPAGYPLFLHALMLLTGSDPLSFAPILNALLFAAVIYISGMMMAKFTFISKWYRAALLSCIVLSPGLLEVYSMLWTETVFILLFLLFMMVMRRYLFSSSGKALITAALIASIASVTRYAGVTIIATGGLLLLMNTKLPIRRRLTDLALFAVISPLLLIINLVRNYTVGGSLMGLREKSITSLIQNSHDAGSVFCDWLPFLNGYHQAAIIVTILIIAGLALIFLKRFLTDKKITDYVGISAVFSVIYILFMIVTASISRFEILNSRFMSPVFIPLLWCGSNWIVTATQQSKPLAKKWWVTLGVILFLGFQYNQLVADNETWDGVKDAGIPGYTEDQWTKSETVLFIQKDSLPFKKGFTIYSNANDAIYFFTGRKGKFLPHKESMEETGQFLADRHCYVVWFDDGENFDLVDKDFILKVKKMELVEEFDDGAIYELDE